MARFCASMRRASVPRPGRSRVRPSRPIARSELGRGRNTSPFTASMRSRMRRPPCDHQPQFEPDAAAQALRERGAALQAAPPRVRICERDQTPPGRVGLASGDLRLRSRRSGQIPPAAGRRAPSPVDGDVLPEVDELQPGADRVRLLQMLSARCAGTAAAAAGRRIGRTAAVVEQLSKSSRSAAP